MSLRKDCEGSCVLLEVFQCLISENIGLFLLGLFHQKVLVVQGYVVTRDIMMQAILALSLSTNELKGG